jgi:hypothetical protein
MLLRVYICILGVHTVKPSHLPLLLHTNSLSASATPHPSSCSKCLGNKIELNCKQHFFPFHPPLLYGFKLMPDRQFIFDRTQHSAISGLY